MIMQSEMYISKSMDDFLSFLRDVQITYNMAQANLEEANLELCDLEHYLEIESCDAIAMVKIAKRIREARKKRRNAKDIIESCGRVLDWISANKRAIHDLSDTLGILRKVESKQENRAYAIRSHILDGITEKSHLINGDVG